MAQEEINLALISPMENNIQPDMMHEAMKFLHWKSSLKVKYDALMRNVRWDLLDL